MEEEEEVHAVIRLEIIKYSGTLFSDNVRAGAL